MGRTLLDGQVVKNTIFSAKVGIVLLMILMMMMVMMMIRIFAGWCWPLCLPL